MERHTFAAGKIMSLENPFDKMKSREERERERGKKESFLEKVESRFERSSEEIWTKISRYANIKFIETFKINIFPKMITIEFEISNLSLLSRNLEILSFNEKHSFRYLHSCYVNNLSCCSNCSHFTNQRILNLLFSSLFYY